MPYFYRMKNGIVLLLIFSFGILTIRNTVVFVYFKINQDYIAENFCRNKNVAGSTCAGTCHFVDLLLEVETEEDWASFPTLPTWKIEDYSLPHYALAAILVPPDDPTRLARLYHYSFPARLRQLGIFHPPRHHQLPDA
ncbi:MAG: hypothetical protein AAFW73_25640 [Bacteroidota bacterium]